MWLLGPTQYVEMILGERIFYHSSLMPPFDLLDVKVLAAVQALKLVVHYNITYVQFEGDKKIND